MNALKLWEISGEISGLMATIADLNGEITPQVEARLDELEGAFEGKVERIALLIQQYKVNADAAKAEEDRLAAIRKSFERSADGLRHYLYGGMLASGHDRVDTPRARVRIQRNTQPTCLYVGDPTAIPPEFQRVTVDVDKRKVLEVWEQTSANPEERTAPDGFKIEWGSHLRIS
jgi:hypothetical protein